MPNKRGKGNWLNKDFNGLNKNPDSFAYADRRTQEINTPADLVSLEISSEFSELSDGLHVPSKPDAKSNIGKMDRQFHGGTKSRNTKDI